MFCLHESLTSKSMYFGSLVFNNEKAHAMMLSHISNFRFFCVGCSLRSLLMLTICRCSFFPNCGIWVVLHGSVRFQPDITLFLLWSWKRPPDRPSLAHKPQKRLRFLDLKCDPLLCVSPWLLRSYQLLQDKKELSIHTPLRKQTSAPSPTDPACLHQPHHGPTAIKTLASTPDVWTHLNHRSISLISILPPSQLLSDTSSQEILLVWTACWVSLSSSSSRRHYVWHVRA